LLKTVLQETQLHAPNRVKVYKFDIYTDPWPDPIRPKSLTRWPVTRRPGSNCSLYTVGLKCSFLAQHYQIQKYSIID